MRHSEGDDVYTALYGHLDLSSIPWSVGDQVRAGEALGHLGAGYTEATDGERQHLHFALHKGESIELAGYVGAENGLGAWYNPQEKLPK